MGAQFVSYSRLENKYVCAACGGKPARQIGRIDDETVDWAECEECGCRDFISQRFYDQQCVEYYEILDKLPEDLRALFPGHEPLDITADEAIEQLFG